MKVKIIMLGKDDKLVEEKSKAIKVMATFYEEDKFIGELRFVPSKIKDFTDKGLIALFNKLSKHLGNREEEKEAETSSSDGAWKPRYEEEEEDKIKKGDWCSQQGGKWVTVKGNHICVREGDTMKESMRYSRLSQKEIPQLLKERTIKDDGRLKEYASSNERRKELWSKYQTELDNAPEGFTDMINRRIVIGSFVTDKENPGDIDIVLLMDEQKTFDMERTGSKELKEYYWKLYGEAIIQTGRKDVSILAFDDNEDSENVIDDIIRVGQKSSIRNYGEEYKGVQH